MRTRTVREGSAGLFVLVGIGFFVLLALWVRGYSLGRRSYRIVAEFSDAAGIQEGASVRFRGVVVGKITKIRPSANGVDVDIEISPADLIIPQNVVIETSQSGLIGETVIDIIPQQTLASTSVQTKPLDANCDSSVIVCNDDRLIGKPGVSVTELVRSSIRFTERFSDPAFFANVQSATKNASEAAAGVTRLTNDVGSLTRAVKQEVGTLSTSARLTTNSVSRAADQIGLTASQVNGLIATNRTTLVSTLNNLDQTSRQLQTTVRSLSPVLDQVKQGQLLRNLETLSANAAQASANLRDVSNGLNSPTNVLVLQQTLDSARATFQNTQKITSDLDELTGDPAFRTNLRNLVNGLSGLVSSTQQLQQEAQIAQVLSVMPRKPKPPIAPLLTPPMAPKPLARRAPSPKAVQSSPLPELIEKPRSILSAPSGSPAALGAKNAPESTPAFPTPSSVPTEPRVTVPVLESAP